jgi:hypothetical protein
LELAVTKIVGVPTVSERLWALSAIEKPPGGLQVI